MQVCFDTDFNIRKIDNLLTQLSYMGSTNESISELLYRINLQRRANTRLIMRSSVNELHTGESGFDSNWTYLQGKLEFEDQKYIGTVN